MGGAEQLGDIVHLIGKRSYMPAAIRISAYTPSAPSGDGVRKKNYKNKKRYFHTIAEVYIGLQAGEGIG